MNKALYLVLLTASITGCAINPPPPPPCADDGRGLFPLNPHMMTSEQLASAPKSGKVEKRSTTNTLRGSRHDR